MKKFYIETYGCQMNVADSEVVAAIMQTTDCEMVDDIADADIVVLNTCSIRDNAEQKVQNRLKELKGKGYKATRRQGNEAIGERLIGVIGCMAERMGETLVKECDGTHSEYCARRVPTLRIKRTSIARSGGNLLRSTV